MKTEELLDARELADFLGVSLRAVYAMRSRGVGPPGWLRGHRLRYRRDDAELFLARERETTLRGRIA
jgi:hypothetical protein